MRGEIIPRVARKGNLRQIQRNSLRLEDRIRGSLFLRRTAEGAHVPAQRGLRVGDHKHCGGSIENATEGLAKGLRVKRRKALVEDDKSCVLEERPGDVEAAPFSVGELPTRLTDQLQHPGRHSVKELPEAELAADGFGLLQIFGLCGPAAAHQEVEGEGSREDVVLMELWCCRHLPPPTCGP